MLALSGNLFFFNAGRERVNDIQSQVISIMFIPNIIQMQTQHCVGLNRLSLCRLLHMCCFSPQFPFLLTGAVGRDLFHTQHYLCWRNIRFLPCSTLCLFYFGATKDFESLLGSSETHVLDSGVELSFVP